MSENNIIKSITTHACPHCGESIFVESQMVPPTVTSLFTTGDVRVAKGEVLTRLQTLDITEDKKQDVIKWLDLPETVFGGEEVENIINSLISPTE